MGRRVEDNPVRNGPLAVMGRRSGTGTCTDGIIYLCAEFTSLLDNYTFCIAFNFPRFGVMYSKCMSIFPYGDTLVRIIFFDARCAARPLRNLSFAPGEITADSADFVICILGAVGARKCE